MLLAIDVGNTNIVVGLFRGERLEGNWRLATDATRTADEYAVLLEGLLGHTGNTFDQVSGVSISSVVPTLTTTFREFGERYLDLPTLVVSARIETGVKIVASYAASSALAKQIEQGAPADIFMSADTDWMDYAINRKTIEESTRVNLLGNRIVLIAPKESKIDNVTIGPGFDLARLAGDGRIATGDVKAVPVGKYAKAALEKLGAWQAVQASRASFGLWPWLLYKR